MLFGMRVVGRRGSRGASPAAATGQGDEDKKADKVCVCVCVCERVSLFDLEEAVIHA